MRLILRTNILEALDGSILSSLWILYRMIMHGIWDYTEQVTPASQEENMTI